MATIYLQLNMEMMYNNTDISIKTDDTHIYHNTQNSNKILSAIIQN